MKYIIKRIFICLTYCLEICISIFFYIKFKNCKVRENSVLLVEPNPFHGEIMPGFINYLQNLGFNVDLYWRYENSKNSSVYKVKNINKYIFPPILMRLVFLDKKISCYKFFFLTTTTFVKPNRQDVLFFDYLGYIPKTQEGVLIVEHNLRMCLDKYNERKYLNSGRLFTLSGVDRTPIVSPHFFVDEIHNSNKNNLTTFIVAGRYLKSSNVFFDAVKNLIKNNISNFKVIVIGCNPKIPYLLRNNVKVEGFIKCPKMFSLINSSDFILPLLNYEDKSHHKFLNESTTGARLLSLGFNKPLVINEIFGKAYECTNKNSIIYSNHELYDAMRKAIAMTSYDYSIMVNNLRLLERRIYQKSLDNLKVAMNKNA